MSIRLDDLEVNATTKNHFTTDEFCSQIGVGWPLGEGEDAEMV